MKKFDTYQFAESYLVKRIVMQPDFVTRSTNEIIGAQFMLTNPLQNKNNHSDYEYANIFFKWLLSGEKELSQELVKTNPWVQRFVDKTGLPENFSSSYAHKIGRQTKSIIEELKKEDSRRAYLNILLEEDKVIREAVITTHEYPCTIGLHFLVRANQLHLIVNMRSNNVWRVLPYDVYNFTCLQRYIAEEIKIKLGNYYHQMNSAHIYSGDVKKIKEKLINTNN